MKTVVTSILVAFTLALQAFFTVSIAQNAKAGNIWYFGHNAGLDFNNLTGGIPAPLVDGKVDTEEGCTSYCDANGLLLFYSNGTFLYDGQNKEIASDLQGNSSSTQSVLAMPVPGTLNDYFLFCVDIGHSAYPSTTHYNITYSILKNVTHMGMAPITTKNIPLNNAYRFGEKLTAYANKDGGFWLITKEDKSDTTTAIPHFLVFKIDSNGNVNNTPVSSPAIAVSGPGNVGHLKVSPDGKHIAEALYTDSAYLYTFHPNDGTVTNGIALSLPHDHGYGCEFSPDNTKLFITTDQYATDQISRFDITSGVPGTINNSRTSIGHPSVDGVGALQTGPDGNIYVALWSANRATAPNYIGVIRNPSTTAMYSEDIMLNANTKGLYSVNSTNKQLSQLGLPAKFRLINNTKNGIKGLQTKFNNVQLYPNPTTGNIYISITGCNQTPTKVVISDVLGNVLISKNYFVEEPIKVDISLYMAGVYFVRIENENAQTVARIVKQ